MDCIYFLWLIFAVLSHFHFSDVSSLSVWVFFVEWTRTVQDHFAHLLKFLGRGRELHWDAPMASTFFVIGLFQSGFERSNI